MTSVSSFRAPSDSVSPPPTETETVSHLLHTLRSVRPSWASDIQPLASEYVFGYGRFLGEYFCRWTSEMVAWEGDAGDLDRAAAATMLLRGVAVLRDYRVDNALPADRYAAPIAAFREGALALFSEVTGSTDLDAIFSVYEAESEKLDAEERRRHWHRVSAFDEDDFRLLGRKTTLCYAPLHILARHADAAKASALRDLICFRNIAVQILDDICDWREDLAAGNITLPLWCAMTAVPDTSPGRGSEEATAGALYGTNTIPVLLDLSAHYITRAALSIRPYDAPSLSSYLSRLGDYVVRLRATVVDVLGPGQPAPVFAIRPGREFSTIARQSDATGDVPPVTARVIAEVDSLLPLFAPRPGVT